MNMIKRNWTLTEDEVLDELEAFAWRNEVYPDHNDNSEFAKALHSPFRAKCDCEWPRVGRSGSGALGIVVEIDLCCLARAVEKLTGEKYYRVTMTEPVFEWDAHELVPLPGTDRTAPRGPMPPYMAKRATKMGIPTGE
jgi:hypothetical protein